jgi:hypothetical protein
VHCCRPFDQLDLIAVGCVNEDEPAAGGSLRGAVGNLNPYGIERGDRLVKILDLEGQMNEVFLDLDRPTWGKTGQFDEFVAVGSFQEGQLRSSRRALSLNHFKAQDRRVKPDGLVQIADPHASVEEFFDFHERMGNGKNRILNLLIPFPYATGHQLLLAGPAVLRRSSSALPGIKKLGIGPISW